MAPSLQHNAVVVADTGLSATTVTSQSPLTPPRSPAATSTSTSVVPSQYELKQRKTTRSIWQPPDIGNINCCITSTYGQILSQDLLVSIALDLLNMDDWMVSVIAQQLRLALSIRTDEESKARSEQELEVLSVIKAEIRKVQRGEAKIHENYLTDGYLLRYWDEATAVVSRVMFWDLKDGTNYKSVIERLRFLEELAEKLALSLDRAHHCLDDNIMCAIHYKWRKYDDLINAFHKEVGHGRSGEDWQSISNRFASYRRSKARQYAETRLKKRIVPILWVDFAVLTVSSMAFLGVGFFYSSGAAGTWRDPDFWFLLQSTIVQLGGLLITGLSFDIFSIYDLAYFITAVIFALIAPVLYVKAPTQYSMLSSAAGGVFQALLILQRAVDDLWCR